MGFPAERGGQQPYRYAPPMVAMHTPEPVRPQFDLSPSFSKSLPHVTVFGVVVCQADFPIRQSDSIVKDVELLQGDLSRYLAIPQAREKIELCLFRSQETYIDFLKKEFRDAPLDRRALYVKKGRGVLLVQLGNNFEIDLRHEMTHAIMHASLKDVPIWLDEGLAKYFELSPGQRAFDNQYLKTIRRNVKFGVVPNLSKLEKLRTIDDMGEKEYRDSWAWTHYLIHRSPQTHLLLAEYLKSLGNQNLDPRNLPKIEPLLVKLNSDYRNDFIEHFKTWEKPAK